MTLETARDLLARAAAYSYYMTTGEKELADVTNAVLTFLAEVERICAVVVEHDNRLDSLQNQVDDLE
jgi:hypothetical protein